MNKIVKESVLLVFAAIPLVYLGSLWNSLPDQVPTHFSSDGPNGWSDKTVLIFAPGLITLGIYLLLVVIPLIDPKKKVQQMGEKYFTLKFMLTLFFCVLSCYVLYISKAGKMVVPNLMNALLGGLFAVLGNYFQTVRPNYFIGIRTPWTLEDEGIWKSTHKLGGKLWLAGGLLIVILSFLLNAHDMNIAMGCIVAVMVIVPVLHSYLAFQKKKNVVKDE